MLTRDRLTQKSGDYCRDECGQDKSCQRLDHARRHNDLSLRCKDVIELSDKEAYLKMAEDYEAEAEKCERKIAVLRAKGHKHAGLKEAEEASKWMDIRDEMRTNARAMRRRAEKAGEEAEK